VGAGEIAKGVFLHEAPSPNELERAIDRVEDALASTGLKYAERGDLKTSQPKLFELLGLQAGRARVTRDEVEMRFECLALVAIGQSAGDRPSGEDAATLLVLRECMHHLGYEGVWREEEGA
jgi:hypothetical protein